MWWKRIGSTKEIQGTSIRNSYSSKSIDSLDYLKESIKWSTNQQAESFLLTSLVAAKIFFTL